jgi:uncharacterized protein (DUF362 family)
MHVSRRRFLELSGAGMTAWAAGCGGQTSSDSTAADSPTSIPSNPPLDCRAPDEPAAVPAKGRSTVVEVICQDSIDASSGDAIVRGAAVQLMLDAALSALAGGDGSPWTVLLPDYTKGMKIGIKANCLSALMSPSSALIGAIAASLKRDLAIDPSLVVVWDRSSNELLRNPGYDSESLGGAQILGTQNLVDASGPGHTDQTCGTFAGSSGSPPRLSRILSEQTHLTINCAVLKTHERAGISGAMKNIFGVIDNPSEYHDSIQTAIPALYALPPIRNSFRLAIIDALFASTVGTSLGRRDATPRRILVSPDPVAIDSYALDLINTLRVDTGRPPLDPGLTQWLDNAYQMGLGTRQYDLVTLDVRS